MFVYLHIKFFLHLSADLNNALLETGNERHRTSLERRVTLTLANKHTQNCYHINVSYITL